MSPYDDALAARVRDALRESGAAADAGPLTEKPMFGGLAFLLGGRMALAASRDGGLLVRVDPAETDALLDAEPDAAPMRMAGRPVTGWVRVSAAGLEAPAAFDGWIARGVARVREL